MKDAVHNIWPPKEIISPPDSPSKNPKIPKGRTTKKQWVRKGDLNHSEDQIDRILDALVKLNPSILPKDRCHQDYDQFDVVSKKGYLVSFWNSGMPRCYYHLKMLWHGPYIIDKCIGAASFFLETPDGERLPISVGRHRLKTYIP